MVQGFLPTKEKRGMGENTMMQRRILNICYCTICLDKNQDIFFLFVWIFFVIKVTTFSYTFIYIFFICNTL